MMRVRPALWIAADLAQELLSRPALLGLMPFSMLVYPFLMGMADGGVDCAPMPFGGDPGLRVSLLTQSLAPAVTILVIGGDILFGRKLKRELEPLLAAPITGAEIILGLAALPTAALALTLPLGFAACELGFGLMACTSRRDPGGDFILFLLSTLVSTVWLLVSTLGAVFKARTATELSLRLTPVWILLIGLDGLRFALHLSGVGWMVIPMLVAGLATGLAALALRARRLDREELVQRI